MTPEEIEAFRGWCRTFEVPPHSLVMKALEHIDQQATALDEAEALIKKNADQINALLAQVAALREIAAEQKAAHIAFVGFHRNMNEDETKNKAQDEARRQLSEEHPEAFG